MTAASAGSYTNSLGVGALTTSNGPNAAPAAATLTVKTPAGGTPTFGKAFSPATINAGGVSTLTITWIGTANTPIAPLTDTLPGGVVVSGSASTTCVGGTATTSTSSVTLTGGSIPASGSCTVTVLVTASSGGNFINSLSNGSTATLTVVPATPGLSLTKTANPTTFTTVGQVIVYTYVVKNTGNVPLDGPFTVNDDKLGAFTCGTATSLAVGASVTCTQNHTITAGDISITTSLPTGVTANINTGVWLSFVNSTQDTTITGASGVPNGTYSCWCTQDHVPDDLHNQPGTLYSTVGGSLPAVLPNSAVWNKVNYTLNHKIHGAGKTNLAFLKDVQTAVWVAVGEQNPEFGVNATAQQMINEANANSSFVPGPNDVVAVLIYSDGILPLPTIRPGEIQESVCEMKPFQAIVNVATGSGTFNGVVVVSGAVQATVTR